MQEPKDRIFFSTERRDYITPTIAIILTLLIHFCVFICIPKNFSVIKEKEKPDELKIEVLAPKLERSRPEFIEANPYANQEVPDASAPQSFQNQRAADEIPDPTSKSHLPFVAGEIKDGKKIVSGTSAKEDILTPQAVPDIIKRPLVQQARPTERPQPVKPAQPAPSAQPTKAEQQKQAAAQKSDGGKDRKSAEQKNSETEGGKTAEAAKNKDESAAQKESDNGFFTAIKRPKQSDNASSQKEGENSNAQKISKGKGDAEKREQAQAAESQQQAQAAAQTPSPAQPAETKPTEDPLPAPKPRPTLSMRIPAGPLADNNKRASNQGMLAVDSRFSEFGAYLQRMIEAISRQWNLLGAQYDLGTAVGTQVVIEFTLDNKGNLVKCETLFSNSTNTGSGLCEQSILTTAPYGEWTQEMVNSLGTGDQSVRITFYYR